MFFILKLPLDILAFTLKVCVLCLGLGVRFLVLGITIFPCQLALYMPNIKYNGLLALGVKLFISRCVFIYLSGFIYTPRVRHRGFGYLSTLSPNTL